MICKLPLLAFCAIIFVAGCRTAPIYNPTDVAFAAPTVSMTRPLALDDYRAAIIRGGATRGWTFDDAGPGHLAGKVAVRGKHFATVDVTFDTQSFSIAYRSSENLKYDPQTQEIHENYNSWINNLQNAIQAEIVQMQAG